jgi:hypothetical protein
MYGFRGVEDVTVGSGRIEIAERETAKRITLKSERKW